MKTTILLFCKHVKLSGISIQIHWRDSPDLTCKSKSLGPEFSASKPQLIVAGLLVNAKICEKGLSF